MDHLVCLYHFFLVYTLMFSVAWCLEQRTMKTVENSTKLPLAEVGNNICPDLSERWSTNHKIKSSFSRSEVLLGNMKHNCSIRTKCLRITFIAEKNRCSHSSVQFF